MIDESVALKILDTKGFKKKSQENKINSFKSKFAMGDFYIVLEVQIGGYILSAETTKGDLKSYVDLENVEYILKSLYNKIYFFLFWIIKLYILLDKN